VPRKKPRKNTSSRLTEEMEVRPDQKLCRRCKHMVPRELQRCTFCRYAPWTWHPNSRIFVMTLLICLFIFFLFPLLNNRDKPYRVPVTDEETVP
jgi:hypothetical protein